MSDNGPPFQSVEYDDFLKQNGILRVLVSPYHPASNGQAERFVQTFKNYLKTSSAQSCLLQRIQSFLLSYRGTPHSTTGCLPAKIFLQRELRTRLSLVKPDTASVVSSSQSQKKSYHDPHARFREFHSGQPILVRNYRSNGKWQPATVLERKGPHSYLIALPDGRLWNRHVDQLLQDSPAPPPLISERSKPIPGNLGSPTGTQVFSTSSTCASSTESTPAAPVVPQPESMDRNPGPSEVAQGAFGSPPTNDMKLLSQENSTTEMTLPRAIIRHEKNIFPVVRY
ncbi:protocadherin, partial, partial [Paramuricea clavata]